MKNKIFNIITIILLTMFIVGTVGVTVSNVYAADGSIIKPGEINAIYGESAANKDALDIAGRVMGLIRNIAVIGGVLLLMILGIKYMMGSVEEKADYKKSLVPLVVGIIVVMASTQIMTMIFGFFDKG